MSDQTEAVTGIRQGPEPSWPARPESRLNRPRRLLLAAGEVVLAVLAVVGAFAVWSAASTTVVSRAADGLELVSTRLSGPVLAGAVGLGALAAVLVVDAVREVVLGLR